MKLKKICYVLVMLIFFLGCHKTPNAVDQIELREDLSESEFKTALIGKWQSVYEHPGKQNVAYLEIERWGGVKVIIKRDGNPTEYEGTYRLSLLRPPLEGNVTLAELTISASKETILLSRVNFGLHNAFSAEEYFLRIDQEPYGVLKKIR